MESKNLMLRQDEMEQADCIYDITRPSTLNPSPDKLFKSLHVLRRRNVAIEENDVEDNKIRREQPDAK